VNEGFFMSAEKILPTISIKQPNLADAEELARVYGYFMKNSDWTHHG
jgi:hypothetical protein